MRLRVSGANVSLYLHDGYDWQRTRKTIEDEIKVVRRRLEKIRQLLASGQVPDESVDDETASLLFNSVYIGLAQDGTDMDSAALLAAIDAELEDGDTASQASSWQSFNPRGDVSVQRPARIRGKRITRSKISSIEINLKEVDLEFDQFLPDDALASRVGFVARDLDIIDNIPTSTWRKFLTEMRSDGQGNFRETDSKMVRVEIRNVRPDTRSQVEEARVKVSLRCATRVGTADVPAIPGQDTSSSVAC